MKKFDDAPYGVIVFDEIYLNDLTMLRKIRKYSLNHPEKIILATGDTSQNKPIDVWSTEIEHKTYAYHCISTMFPTQIKLTLNKRLKTEEGRQRLNNIYNDIFNNKIYPSKTIAKYFKFTSQPSDSNISYRNEIASDVSRTKRQLLKKEDEYEVNEKLLCIQYFKTTGTRNLNDAPPKVGGTQTMVYKLSLIHI